MSREQLKRTAIRFLIVAPLLLSFVLTDLAGLHFPKSLGLNSTALADGPGGQQPVQPVLTVAGKFTGANEPEGIKIAWDASEFNYSFQITNTEKREVKGLVVEVPAFPGPGSLQRKVDWEANKQPGDQPATVPALGSVRLE